MKIVVFDIVDDLMMNLQRKQWLKHASSDIVMALFLEDGTKKGIIELKNINCLKLSWPAKRDEELTLERVNEDCSVVMTLNKFEDMMKKTKTLLKKTLRRQMHIEVRCTAMSIFLTRV